MINDKTGKGYHKLIVWQKTRDFVYQIYKYSDSFPKAEEFGLKGQLRRAAVSVVLNIVEGYRRRSTREFLRFLDIAQASLAEVEAILELLLDLKYISSKEYVPLEQKRMELAYLMNGLVKSLNKKL